MNRYIVFFCPICKDNQVLRLRTNGEGKLYLTCPEHGGELFPSGVLRWAKILTDEELHREAPDGCEKHLLILTPSKP